MDLMTLTSGTSLHLELRALVMELSRYTYSIPSSHPLTLTSRSTSLLMLGIINGSGRVIVYVPGCSSEQEQGISLRRSEGHADIATRSHIFL